MSDVLYGLETMESFDVSTVKDMKFYIMKLRAVCTRARTDAMQRDACKILRFVKEKYPEEFI